MENALLRLMYEQSTNHAVILMDPAGGVVGWNTGAATIFGRAAGEMLGQTLHVLFTAEDRAAQVPETELENARRAGTGEDNRWMLRADGAHFWASGAVQCLRSPDGAVAGFAKVLRDRTDGRGQVELLHNRVDFLMAEERHKILVLGTLAHELRNPLAAITNAVQLIDLSYPNDQKLVYPLQILRRQTTHVDVLIGDLLDAVRLRTGKTVLRYTTLELGPLLRDALETVKPRIDGCEQRITVLQPPVPIRLDGDAVRLKQVFVNLIENASKYTPPGGAIVVTCSVEAEEAVVKIEDNGRGIPAALLPHIFDWLTQAEDPVAATPEGLGLGLSIVREFVALHGGSVQVRSAGIGHGSEFTVRLPLRSSLPSP